MLGVLKSHALVAVLAGPSIAHAMTFEREPADNLGALNFFDATR